MTVSRAALSFRDVSHGPARGLHCGFLCHVRDGRLLLAGLHPLEKSGAERAGGAVPRPRLLAAVAASWTRSTPVCGPLCPH